MIQTPGLLRVEPGSRSCVRAFQTVRTGLNRFRRSPLLGLKLHRCSCIRSGQEFGVCRHEDRKDDERSSDDLADFAALDPGLFQKNGIRR